MTVQKEWANIHELAWKADPKSSTPERERIEALQVLLSIYRSQVDEFRQGSRSGINPLLRQWITEWGLRIFADADPTHALAVFLGKKQKRGKRAKNANRDFEIATAVARNMLLNSMSLDDAAASVAEAKCFGNLSEERIENIYKANSKAARAHVAILTIDDRALKTIGEPHVTNIEHGAILKSAVRFWSEKSLNVDDISSKLSVPRELVQECLDELADEEPLSAVEISSRFAEPVELPWKSRP